MINMANRFCGSLALTRVLTYVTIIFTLSGCQVTDRIKKERVFRNNRAIVQEVLNDWKSKIPSSFEFPRLPMTISSTDKHLALNYIINDECVVCIADFIDFVKCFSPTDSLSIIGIAQEENMNLLTYYCNELLTKKERENTMLLPVGPELYRNLSDKGDNVFLLFGNDLIDSFLYSNGRLYE